MSNRDTDEQLSLNSSPSLFPLNRSFAATSGFSLAGILGGRTTQLQADPEQPFRMPPTYLVGNSKSPATIGPEAIEFRVTRDGSPSRRLRLSGRRYTFGSGEGCSIRLADVSLRPMHAVLIRDAHRVLVRAYSVPILVNGNRTTEAAISVGDLLQLGSYTLEMLGSGLHAPPSRVANDDDIDRDWDENAFKLRFADGPKISSSRSGLSKLSREPFDRAASLADEESIWRDQLRREVEQWRMAKAECDRRESRCDDRETNMRERESELWNRSEHLRRRESELKAQEAAVLEIQQEYELKKQSLARLQAEDRKRREEFQRREAEFLKLEQEYRDQIEEVTRQLQRSQDQASVANETVQRMRDQFTALNGQLADLTAKQSELREQDQKKSAELRRTRKELEHARDVAIAERDLAIAERDASVTQQEAALAALERARVAAISERDEAIADRDELASQSNELVAQHHDAVAELEARIVTIEKARNSAINERNKAIAERDELVTQSGELIAQRDRAVSEREASVVDRDQAVRDRDEAETQCVQAIRNRDESVLQRNAALQERDAVIDARAQSDALRIQLIKDLAKATERLEEVEIELAESRRLIEQNGQSTDSWEQQVLQLQESVVSAKNETRLLRSEYEAACESIERLEALVKEQSQHSNESKDSWTLEAEHLRQSFEAVSRDLAVALGELSHLRDANTEFASQLESVRSEKARIESELESRPTQDAWREMEGELERASESLQIIQRDYDATLTELNHLRLELQDERQWDGQRADSQNADIPALENPIAEVNSPVVEPEPIPLAPSEANSAAMGWSTPLYPTDSQVHEAITDETKPTDVESQSESWNWPTADADDTPMGHVVNQPSTDDEYSMESSVGEVMESGRGDDASYQASLNDNDVESDSCSSVSNEVEDDDVNYGSLAERLIADLHRNDAIPANDAEANYTQDEDQENEAFFEATAIHADIHADLKGRTDFDHKANQDESSELSPWSNSNSSDETDFQPTVVRGEYGLHSDGPVVGGIEVGENQESEIESTSPWAGSRFGQDSYDDTLSRDQYNDNSTFDQDSSDDSNTYTANDDFGIANEGFLTDSGVWTGGSDSVVMDSELVASDDEVSNFGVEAKREEMGIVPTPEPASPELEDDSIEAYMNRLLQRAQGSASSGGDSTVSKTISTATANATVAVQSERSGSTRIPSQEIPEDYDPDAPLMPRSQAPEKQGSLNAMRQLANESARTAINRSVKIQSRDTQLKAFAKFASAAGLIFCALAMFVFSHFPGTAIIACCMCVVAFVWVNEGMKLLGAARRRVQLAAAGKLEQEEANQLQEDARAIAQTIEDSKT